jgi:hypothetical protein
MKRVFLFACLALGSAIVGCGGGGLDSKKQLSALDDSEAKTLCADATVVTKDCGGGLKVTTNNTAECELSVKSLPDTCTATVADYDTCDAADPCDKLTTAACAKIFACTPAK